uniref:Golgi associated, gamma adaptin ear containing, ARF binding protein 2 n=1 Tax=Latimeria chalumnae TaxID=7897 RepID=H3AZ37_LATCH
VFRVTQVAFFSDKATDPSSSEEQWEFIQGFCDQVNKEPEGPQIATRLLGHKIQSPQEREALHALTVLETCINSCGKKFHREVGKFRFLNELIKLLSPKYLGTWTSEKVKAKTIEILFSWTVWLPEEVKIQDAYQMLKKQGIIKQDPQLPVDKILPPPSPRANNSIFDDEEKSKLLARLLKSSHSEDLQAANRLIKTMMKEDQEKMEKVSKRIHTIEEVLNNTKLLNEMLVNYRREKLSDSDKDIMESLYERCEKLRPALFRLASDTVDNDDALAEILQANDKLTQVVTLYKQVFEGHEVNGDTTVDQSKSEDSEMVDIRNATINHMSKPFVPFPVLQGPQTPERGHTSSLSLLDEELMSLGLNDPPLTTTTLSTFSLSNSASTQHTSHNGLSLFPLHSGVDKESEEILTTTHVSVPGNVSQNNGLHELDLLGKSLMQQSLTPQQINWAFPQPEPTLRSRSTDPPRGTASPAVTTLLPKLFSPPFYSNAPSQQHSTEFSLADVFVPLESIKPSSVLPVTAYDKNGFRVMMHFAKDSPPGRPDVLVIVISMLNTSPLSLKNIVFQAAVPKVMRVKLQAASGNELPVCNPLLPPAVISQVLLLSNPQKERVRLRYKLTFTQGDQSFTEVGEVDQFPDANSWGRL